MIGLSIDYLFSPGSFLPPHFITSTWRRSIFSDHRGLFIDLNSIQLCIIIFIYSGQLIKHVHLLVIWLCILLKLFWRIVRYIQRYCSVAGSVLLFMPYPVTVYNTCCWSVKTCRTGLVIWQYISRAFFPTNFLFWDMHRWNRFCDIALYILCIIYVTNCMSINVW